MPALIIVRRAAPSRPLGIQPVESARVGNRLPQVVDAGDPGDEPLHAHPEPGVRDRPVATAFEISLDRFVREPVLLDATHLLIVFAATFPTANHPNSPPPHPAIA